MRLSNILCPAATLVAGASAACNPMTTNNCPLIPGLAASSYSVDFTKENSLPKDWILANAANVTFGDRGAQFNFNKRKDAPYIWTNFYVAFGRIDIEMQVANGTGVVTSGVMYSDDNDEIDWEFTGSNLGAGESNGRVQTNVFGKGLTGNYDRGTFHDLSPTPQTSFHIYSINWTPDKIEWVVDGKLLRTLPNDGKTTGNYQYPQTPSRLHLGVWDAGDPDTAPGTRQWAGGLTNYEKIPYVAYVKTVNITTLFPCKAWRYPNDFNGTFAHVNCENDTVTSSSVTTTSSSATPRITDTTYTVVKGDNGYSIAEKIGCTFDQLSAANPSVKWDFLDIGQKLNNPSAFILNPAVLSNAYTVVRGDNGYLIAQKIGCTFDQLSTANPGVKWDFLDIGQKLNKPNILSSTYRAPTSTSSSSSSTTSSSSSSSTISNFGSTLSNFGCKGCILSITSSTTTSSSTTSTRTTTSILTTTSTSTMSVSCSSCKSSTIPSTITSTVSSTISTSTKPLTCYRDDCFNVMTASQYLNRAWNYCLVFTKSDPLRPQDWLSACAQDDKRIISACKCFNSYYTVSSGTMFTISSTWFLTTSSTSGTTFSTSTSSSSSTVPSTTSTSTKTSLSTSTTSTSSTTSSTTSTISTSTKSTSSTTTSSTITTTSTSTTTQSTTKTTSTTTKKVGWGNIYRGYYGYRAVRR